MNKSNLVSPATFAFTLCVVGLTAGAFAQAPGPADPPPLSAPKGSDVYVFARSWHTPTVPIKALAKGRALPKKVELLGSKEPVEWEQDDNALVITLPTGYTVDIPIYTFKVSF